MSTYLDYNATTPTDPRVVDAMLPYFTEIFGNAASVDHIYGHEAHQAVEAAREQVAALLGATADEITFTSGATEADNLAVTGTMARVADDAEAIVTAIEHPAVLEPAKRLGARLRVAPVSPSGVVDPEGIRKLLTGKTALVSVMAANNETGAIQPIAEVGQICAEAEVVFHSDAVQAVGRIDVDVDAAHLALLSLSAHKIYGPKGVGALYARRRGQRARVSPLHYGGGHERNLRPGTVNVPGIVGLGVAAELARLERQRSAHREHDLKVRIVESLSDIGGVEFNAGVDLSLPQTVSVRIAGVSARALMHATRDQLAFSTGSACTTTKVEPSHVLLAQGLAPGSIAETVRISFGRFTTDEDITNATRLIAAASARLRRVSRAAA
jgi:cysteine desulfurase